jgi:molybdate transport system ATP-binding protein
MDRLARAAGAARVSGLSVSVQGKAGEFALDAAFAAESGITALFGPSGSGKTTVLRMIAGTKRPESGRIALGEDALFDSAAAIDVPPARRRVGFIFQDGRLFPHLSVRRNLTYARWAGRRQATRSFDEVVALLGLEDLLDRSPENLSGGERQRVAIGRALLADPRLLLMDEPLSSLDQARRQEVMPYLEAIRAETPIPIVYVSHQIDEVARLADTLVVMEGGRVLAADAAVIVFGRLDLGPVLGGLEAGALIEGVVAGLDLAHGLALVDIGGSQIELIAENLSAGEFVRCRVRARDVAIATQRPLGLSVRNVLACTIAEIAAGEGPYAELSLRLGRHFLRARITRKSAGELRLQAGMEVFAVLKAVSVERRPFHNPVPRPR